MSFCPIRRVTSCALDLFDNKLILLVDNPLLLRLNFGYLWYCKRLIGVMQCSNKSSGYTGRLSDLPGVFEHCSLKQSKQQSWRLESLKYHILNNGAVTFFDSVRR